MLLILKKSCKKIREGCEKGPITYHSKSKLSKYFDEANKRLHEGEHDDCQTHALMHSMRRTLIKGNYRLTGFLLHKIRIILLLFKINHNHQASDGECQPGKS